MKEQLSQLAGLAIAERVSLADLTTFRIGGVARYFVEVRDKVSLRAVIMAARSLSLPYYLLGGGSNVLISDRGFDGLVIRLRGGEVTATADSVSVFAGYSLGALARRIWDLGFCGLEFAANIPGTVGGAVRGNAGAYGHGVGDFVISVTALDARLPEVPAVELPGVACAFAYRDSLFKHENGLIIAEINFSLPPLTQKQALLEAVEKEALARRAGQPWEYPSAGCAFQNVPFTEEDARCVEFVLHDKIPAARLIDECDLKGLRIGGAEVSPKHANFIINTGTAKAEDVAQLISVVKTKVRNQFGVQLREEIEYVGF